MTQMTSKIRSESHTMMPNDDVEVVRQHKMVVMLIRLRQMNKLKESKPNDQLTL